MLTQFGSADTEQEQCGHSAESVTQCGHSMKTVRTQCGQGALAAQCGHSARRVLTHSADAVRTQHGAQ